ncbi:hypothetical protein CY35_05G126800 [Sphagnum magellanicum]|nr:hypothetical protein CY35_05G126800 [Sphagnum magellanicum]
MGCFRRRRDGTDKKDADVTTFSLQHLRDQLNLLPIESNYCTSGSSPVDEVVGHDANNMRRLYVHENDRVLIKIVYFGDQTSVGVQYDENGDWHFRPIWAHRAGPRAQIYFHPEHVKAAIVTCGGLCPGLNDVIRQIVFSLDVYGVREILGIQHGFKGFVDDKFPPMKVIFTFT